MPTGHHAGGTYEVRVRDNKTRELVTVHVVLEANLYDIAQQLGAVAYNSKGKRSQSINGAVVVTVAK